MKDDFIVIAKGILLVFSILVLAGISWALLLAPVFFTWRLIFG